MKKRDSAPTHQQSSEGAAVFKDSSTSISDKFLLSRLPKQDLLNLAFQINEYISKEYPVMDETALLQQTESLIPVSIFAGKLSPLEALTKFLKENRGMANRNIGKAIGRDERGVWISYRNAKRKMKSGFTPRRREIFIPIDIFTKEFSILESVVNHLRTEHEMKGTEIAALLNKSPSTVWTVYNRAKKKEKKQKKDG